MPFYNCKLGDGNVKILNGLLIKNSGATVPTQHQPSGGWSGEVKANGSITIKFPDEIDLSRYKVSGGTIDAKNNSLAIGYTATMTGSAGYYYANVSGSTVTITEV